VFIPTNKLGSNEFRFYRDENRNGVFDPSGLQPVVAPNGEHYKTDGTTVPGFPQGVTLLSNYFQGDPQWIGVLDRSAYPPGVSDLQAFRFGYPHSATNQFISRYAFMVVPISDTLDINYIHNYAKGLNPLMQDSVGDGFMRDQGVGTW